MRKLLVILAAVMSTAIASAAQKESAKSDWKSMYRKEVSVGFAVTGKVFETYFVSPGDEWGPDVGSVYSARSNDIANGSASTVLSRPFIETVHGLQFNKYFFAGVGTGLQYYCGKLNHFQSYADAASAMMGKSKTPNRWNAVALPIFVDIRGMYPINEELIPFINLSLGATPVFGSSIRASYSLEDQVRYKQLLKGGLYCEFGGGISWKDYSLSIGLQRQNLKVASITKYDGSKMEEQLKMKANAFFIKIGYNF